MAEIKEYGKTVKRKIYNYEKHKETTRINSIAYRARKREFYDSLKTGPCEDCGGKFHPAAMDFHHPNDDKGTDVSKLIYCAKERLLAEVEKCILICANCHRVRHHPKVSA